MSSAAEMIQLSKGKQLILAGTLAIAASLGATYASGMTKAGLVLVAGTGAALAWRLGDEVGADDIASGLKGIALELWQDQDPLELEDDVPDEVVEMFSPPSALKLLTGKLEDLTTPDFWTFKRAAQPAVMVGKRRSGKSRLFSYKAQQLYYGGVSLLIADYHFNPANPDDPEHVNWLPGVDLGEMLVQDPAVLVSTTMSLLTEGRERMKGNRPKDTSVHLLVDEWEGWMKRMEEEDQEFMGKAMEEISYEFAKVGISMSFTCKSIKLKQTGLDSTVFDGADLYLMGTTINTRHQAFPADLASARNRLSAERDQVLTQVDISQRVLIFRDALDGESRVVVTPDLRRAGFHFEEPTDPFERWWKENLETINEFAARGDSLTQLTETLKVRRGEDNPIYVELRDRYNDLTKGE